MIQEKLQKIRAKCVELLAIAEKRTPGKWEPASESVWAGDEKVADCDGWNPDFIAACAGSAEAGWRSTIAAIDLCLDSPTYYANIADSILSAWSDELL